MPKSIDSPAAPPVNVQDFDTRHGVGPSDNLPLQHITHNRLPPETALADAMRVSADIVRHTVTQTAGEAALTDAELASIHAVLGPEHQHETTPPPAAMDQALAALQARYHAEDKHPTFDEGRVLAFAKEAQTQRLKPADQQNWEAANDLWIDAQVNRLPYDRRKGDRTSSQIYIATANLGLILTMIPAMITLGTKAKDLQEHGVVKAIESLGLQAAMVPITPLILAFLRVMLLPAMENVRQGSPMRSKEMKTRDLKKIVADLHQVDRTMNTLTADMESARATLDDLNARNEQPSEALAHCQSIVDRMAAASQRVGELSIEYAAKKDTDGLNDVFTTWRTRVRMLQVGANFVAGVVGTATKHHPASAKISAGIQVAGGGTAMLWNQLQAGTSDDKLKQDATIFATAASSNILVPASRSTHPDDITMADIDLSDFEKQWKGPLGLGVSQVEEYLSFNIKLKEQDIDALLGLEPGESATLERLEAKPAAQRSADETAKLADIDARKMPPLPESDDHARLVALRTERNELKNQKTIVSAGEHWADLAPDIKKVLHDALADGVAPLLRHTVRLGMVRMAQPSDFNPQVVQLLAGALQLLAIAGSSFPLLTQGTFRLVNAIAKERGEDSPIPDGVRYAMGVFAAAIGLWGAYSAAHLIRKKIAQRNDMRADAADHGETFGILQNLHYKNLLKAASNLGSAMFVSVTGPLEQHRAAKAMAGVTQTEAGARRRMEALMADMQVALEATLEAEIDHTAPGGQLRIEAANAKTDEAEEARHRDTTPS